MEKKNEKHIVVEKQLIHTVAITVGEENRGNVFIVKTIDCIEIRKMNRGGSDMQIVSKVEFANRLKDRSREDLIEMLYRAYDELTRIEKRCESIWYKDIYFDKGKEVVDDNTIISLDDTIFRCVCGANVFTKYDDGTFTCHGCKREYIGDDE